MHVHVRKEEHGIGLTPTIENLSVGHVLDKHNGKVVDSGSASHPIILLIGGETCLELCWRKASEETKPDWPDWMHGYLKG